MKEKTITIIRKADRSQTFSESRKDREVTIEAITDQTTANMSETMKLRNLDCLYFLLVPMDLKIYPMQRIEVKVSTVPNASVTKKILDSQLFQ